ncbi:MAG: TIGR03960 family B12-binding radical SAM protein [Candidatus Eisenbacteria bacterium]|uniref:TIGR03960 family B12-binding radical SAM protein n=1 Tax=Eiseniibacteriota bacterium TaxID=2212470 RepID=A0A938BNW4_UNCEI|nr:TIGR03960 family B12-binding radical SAM protein [Candidatus Eisenbacteria bacterium]
MRLAEAIEALLPLVEKPARYLNGEIHARYGDWREERTRWLLILPDTYELGMSHLGLRILYDILNRDPHSHAERAFAPWIDMEQRLRDARLPLFGLESRRPARDFDLLGFSWPYELLATNILNLLDLAGIPLESAARGEEDPLIAAGGPCTGNPEPLADFVDFFLIGDGEEAAPEISRRLLELRGRTRAQRLLALTRIPGVYAPGFYAPRYCGGRQVGVEPRADVPMPVRRVHVADLDAAPYPRAPVVPLIEAVQDRLTLEIQRGCTHGCRFCQAGIFYRPLRERSPRTLVDLVADGLAATGWDEISLSSLSSADYSQIEPLARALMDALAPARTGISFSSLRADSFGVELAGLVARARKTGLTFAPEAGTQRLRDVINKGIRDEDLLQAVAAAYERGWRRVKLYFMVGLPTETRDDIEGLAALVERLRPLGRARAAGPRVTVSVGAFVPKAQTPFQWEPFADRAELRARMDFLRARLSTPWSEVKTHAVEPSWVEALLARGDRRCGTLIRRVWAAGGRFEGWSEHFSVGRWERALAECGVDPELHTGARDPDLPLPWDHIDLGVRKSWLRRERERALRGESTPDCRDGACTMCGLGGPQDRRIAAPPDEEAWRELARGLAERLGLAGASAIASGPRRESAEGDDGQGRAGTIGEGEGSGPDGLPLRIRLGYRKTGPLRFIAHLETGRLLARLLRMARWPLAFSQGHRPHPRIAYGPPLPLGVAGERELVDLYLWRAPGAEDLAGLNALAPRGLEFFEARPAAARAASLAAAAAAALYRVEIPADLAARARREGRLEQFHAAGALPYGKPSKGRRRTIDLRRCVAAMAWLAGEPGAGERHEGEHRGGELRSREANARVILEARLLLQERDGHVLGPLPLLREIFAWSAEELARCLIVRERLLGEDGRPLDPRPGGDEVDRRGDEAN